MFPSYVQFFKTLVLVVVLGYLLAPDSSEARSLDEQQQDEYLNYNQGDVQQAQQQLAAAAATATQGPMLNTAGGAQNLDRLDSDDDEDDDDRVQQVQPDQQNYNYQEQQQQQPMTAPAQMTAGSDLYQTDQSYQPPYQAPSQDLRTAASKHYGHHKHGAKGWLDMGAWTGKKGAFGWYDKHPVGKGRK